MDALATAGCDAIDAYDTPRLRLRPLAPGDRALYRALYTDPRVMGRIAAPLADDAADRGFAAACRRNALPAGLERRWAVVDRRTGSRAGLLALFRDADDRRGAEVGVMLLPAAQGRGMAIELLRAVLARTLGDPGSPVRRLWARHASGHAAAAAVLAAAGFHAVPRSGPDATWEARRARWSAGCR